VLLFVWALPPRLPGMGPVRYSPGYPKNTQAPPLAPSARNTHKSHAFARLCGLDTKKRIISDWYRRGKFFGRSWDLSRVTKNMEDPEKCRDRGVGGRAKHRRNEIPQTSLVRSSTANGRGSGSQQSGLGSNDWSPLGRAQPRYRWGESVQVDLRHLQAESWQEVAQEQDKWRALVSEAKIGSLSQNCLLVS
jgi:hypothetical protein